MHHEAFPFFVPVMVMPVQKITQPLQVNNQAPSSLPATTTNPPISLIKLLNRLTSLIESLSVKNPTGRGNTAETI